jgi:hypothetical protein
MEKIRIRHKHSGSATLLLSFHLVFHILVQEVKESPPGTTAQLQHAAHDGPTAEKKTDESEPWLLQQAGDGGTLLEIAAQIIEGGRP